MSRQDQFNIVSSEMKNAYRQQQFSIETKNGVVVKASISLNGNPNEILKSMAALCNFPLPPSSPARSTSSEVDSFRFLDNPDMFQFLRYGGYARPNKRLDQDINLLQFLESRGLSDDIKERKFHRMNANAAAEISRRLYKFISIDGTRLGWNSKSMAICLQRLIALHDDHHNKFRTSSFYPFRLILSSDEFQRKVDLWAGDIRLNPASTSVQWLAILENVTNDSVRTLKTNQQTLKKNLSIVEDALQLRVVKGHSCDAQDYFECIRRLARQSEERNSEMEKTHESKLTILSNNSSLVIESDQACRRGKLRQNGSFEVSTCFSYEGIRSTISKYAIRSNEILNAESNKKKKCDLMMQQLTNELGVQKVSKPNVISNDQMIQCLSMLLGKDDLEKEALRRLLAGHNIVISTGGKLHLGDDGSIIVPYNVS